MKIIEKGIPEDKVEKEVHCHRCNTLFSYNNKDIQPDSRDGSYVICPGCKTFIGANRIVTVYGVDTNKEQ